jgi:hypothetical protein
VKILFTLFARLGDVCCGIPAFRALKVKYPLAELHWLTLRAYMDLVPRCGNPCSISTDEPFGRPPDLTAGFDRVYQVQPMWRHEEWASSGLHVIDLIAKWCDVELSDRSISIDVPSEITAKVGRMPLPERFIAIGSSPTISSRNLLPEHFPSIVEYCRANSIPYASVGGVEGVQLPGAINFCGHLSPLETVALINRASLYIGPDNGTSWLACAAKKPVKVCLVDQDRIKDGVVGFRDFQSDKRVHDVFYQDGLERLISVIDQGWKEGA